MALLNNQFNSNEHDEMVDFSVLPADKYMAHIVASEIKDTKNRLGKYLQLEFDIDTPAFKGRKVWTRLNIENTNQTAVEMAYRELTSICNAIDVQSVSDTSVLHGKPMIIKLKITPATSQYSESNEIVSYSSVGDMGVQQTVPGMEAQAQAQAQAQPQAQSADAPPWAT